MRLRKHYVIAAILLLLIAGCAKKTTTTTPPPPGAVNAADAAIYQTLAPIHAFVNSLVAQNNAGQITLTATQKADLNMLVADVNAASVLYQAWHAAGAPSGTGQTAVQNAVSKAQTDQTALNAAIQGGK